MQERLELCCINLCNTLQNAFDPVSGFHNGQRTHCLQGVNRLNLDICWKQFAFFWENLSLLLSNGIYQLYILRQLLINAADKPDVYNQDALAVRKWRLSWALHKPQIEVKQIEIASDIKNFKCKPRKLSRPPFWIVSITACFHKIYNKMKHFYTIFIIASSLWLTSQNLMNKSMIKVKWCETCNIHGLT